MDVGKEMLVSPPRIFKDLERTFIEFCKALSKYIQLNGTDKDTKDIFEYILGKKDAQKLVHGRLSEKELNEKLSAAYQNGKGFKTVLIRDFCVKDFENAMNDMGCSCVTARCTSGPNKGLIMCCFKNEDEYYAKIARERALSHGRTFMDEYGNKVLPSVEISISTLQQMNLMNGYNHVSKLPTMNTITAKSVMEEFRLANIPFAKQIVEKDGKEYVDILFLQDNKERAGQAYAKAKIDELGISGTYHYQKIQKQTKNIHNALNQIEKSEKEFYVLSANDIQNMIHVTNSMVVHQRVDENDPFVYRIAGGKEENRDYVNLRKVYKQEVDCMKNPVVLTKEEYEANCSNAEQLREIVNQKSEKVIYASKEDKLQAYLEQFFKNQFNRIVYDKIRANMFDIEMEKDRFEDVKNGKITLPEFLNIDRDPCFPFKSYTQITNRMDQIIDQFESLSENEQQNITNMIEKCIDEYDKSENVIHEKYLDEKDLVQSIDELMQDASENKPFHNVDLETEMEMGGDFNG